MFQDNGDEVAITTMEYDLLCAFLASPNHVLSRDQLLMKTRNREWEPFDRSIDIPSVVFARRSSRSPRRSRAAFEPCEMPAICTCPCRNQASQWPGADFCECRLLRHVGDLACNLPRSLVHATHDSAVGHVRAALLLHCAPSAVMLTGAVEDRARLSDAVARLGKLAPITQ